MENLHIISNILLIQSGRFSPPLNLVSHFTELLFSISISIIFLFLLIFTGRWCCCQSKPNNC